MKNSEQRELKSRIIIFFVSILLLSLVIAVLYRNLPERVEMVFDEDRAYGHVLTQMEFGPRTPGSEAHSSTVDYIQKTLLNAGWKVEVQESESLGHPIRNVVAKIGEGTEWIILGAHYDSRLLADSDSVMANRSMPVPGANDGASGVAVLLELARVLPRNPDKEIWMVFFDLEDQGNIEGWNWILGSQSFAQNLTGSPDAVVIIDMIGDADLNIHREKSSTPELVDEIWEIAAEFGYSNHFINSEKYTILDDHTPFLNAGLTAIDIIDFDYPYWHTIEDNADKVSPRSLKIVGDVLLAWLTR